MQIDEVHFFSFFGSVKYLILGSDNADSKIIIEARLLWIIYQALRKFGSSAHDIPSYLFGIIHYWGARKNRFWEILFGRMKKMLRTTYDTVLINPNKADRHKLRARDTISHCAKKSKV